MIGVVAVCFAVLVGTPPAAAQGPLHSGTKTRLVYALSEAWRWTQFTTESGLPSDSVHDVIETPSGIVWAATSRGIAWFDGHRWQAVGPADGIPADHPREISAHGDDEILVVMGRDLYRGDAEGFEQVEIVIDGFDYFVHSARRADGGKNFVVASKNEGSDAGPSEFRNAASLFFLYDGETFESLGVSFDLPWDRYSFTAWTNERDSIFMNEMAELRRWRDGQWSTMISLPAPGPLMRFDRVLEKPNGDGMAGVSAPAEARGIWEWTANTEPSLDEDQPTDLLESIDIAASGDAILAYRSGDVRVRDQGDWVTVPDAPPQMAGMLFLKFRSTNNDLWVGTQRGLFLFRHSVDRWKHWEVPSPDHRNEALEIVEASDGKIWVATGDGIAVHHPDGGVEWIDQIAGTELYEITGLAEDVDGCIWVSSGSRLDGAYRWDGTTWTHFGAEQGLHAPLVHKIRKDRRGRLWFLGMAELTGEESEGRQPGAFLYDDGQFIPYTTVQGLTHGRLYDFSEGPTGDYWFATFSGISRLRDNVWTHWTMTNSQLRRNRTFTIEADQNGVAWFGDQRSGLGRIGADDEVSYLTTADGLINDAVQEIRLGTRGELWISTSGGVSRYDDGDWLNFDVAAGLSSPRTWPIVPLDDRVLIGTSGNGVDVLDFSEEALPPPRIEFEDVVADEGAAFLRWKADAYWGIRSRDALRTRFRMDGGPWSPFSTRREAEWQGLGSGEHVFEVQAEGMFGGINHMATPLVFEIPPPIFLQPRFYGPTGLLLGLVVLLMLSRSRHKSTLRERDAEYRRQLEERVDERTEALRESEERLRLVLDSAHVIPWVTDVETFDYTYVGRQATEVLGYPVEDWYERSFWSSHLHPDDAEATIARFNEQSTLHERYELEYRMIAADGSVVWFQDLINVVKSDGKPTALRGFLIDITARKQAELERLDAEAEAHEHRERLAHLSRLNMLGEMATGIAHEVNQPLTAVSTYTQACRRMLDAGIIDENQVHDVLGRISEEAVRAGDMIHGLKALVRKRTSEMSVSNANDLVTGVMPLAEVEARDLGIHIKLDLDPDLPDVLADDVQVQQVILNLLRNAIEATGSQGGDVTVRTSCAAADLIQVDVLDEGTGLNHDDPDQAFQPFFSTKSDGMGMGLSISRSIIEAHGGQIGYSARDAGGAHFFFTLPADLSVEVAPE